MLWRRTAFFCAPRCIALCCAGAAAGAASKDDLIKGCSGRLTVPEGGQNLLDIATTLGYTAQKLLTYNAHVSEPGGEGTPLIVTGGGLSTYV